VEIQRQDFHFPTAHYPLSQSKTKGDQSLPVNLVFRLISGLENAAVATFADAQWRAWLTNVMTAGAGSAAHIERFLSLLSEGQRDALSSDQSLTILSFGSLIRCCSSRSQGSSSYRRQRVPGYAQTNDPKRRLSVHDESVLPVKSFYTG
jgi:hypothetical protein